MRGMNYCYPAYVLDAIQAIWKAFESLIAKEVSNCWLKSGILSSIQVQVVCREHERHLPKYLRKTIGVAVCGEYEVDVVANVEYSIDKRTRKKESDVDELLSLVDKFCEGDYTFLARMRENLSMCGCRTAKIVKRHHLHLPMLIRKQFKQGVRKLDSQSIARGAVLDSRSKATKLEKDDYLDEREKRAE
eukprot:IDg16230t1